MHDYDEKRSFMRMQVETKLSFSVQGKPSVIHQGFSRDLSATGLLMSSDFAPQQGDRIEISIETKNERYEPFTAHGSVIRVETSELASQRYMISVEFDVAE